MGRDPLLAVTTRRGRWGSAAVGLGDPAARVGRLPEGLAGHAAGVRQVDPVEHDPRAGRARVGVTLPEADRPGLGPGAGAGAHPADPDLLPSPEPGAERERERDARATEVAGDPEGRVRLAVGRDVHVLGLANAVHHDAHATRADRVERRGQRDIHRVTAAGTRGGTGAHARVAALARRAGAAAGAAVRDVVLQVATLAVAERRAGEARGAGVSGGRRRAAVGVAVGRAAADAVAADRTRGAAVSGRGGAGVGRGGGRRRHLADVRGAAGDGRDGDEREDRGERGERGLHGVFIHFRSAPLAADLQTLELGEPRSQPPCDGRQRRVRTGR